MNLRTTYMTSFSMFEPKGGRGQLSYTSFRCQSFVIQNVCTILYKNRRHIMSPIIKLRIDLTSWPNPFYNYPNRIFIIAIIFIRSVISLSLIERYEYKIIIYSSSNSIILPRNTCNLYVILIIYYTNPNIDILHNIYCI